MTEKYCVDCYFMYWIDEETKEEMDCANGNAIPEIEGVPELIVSEPHNCPFYKGRSDWMTERFNIVDLLETLAISDNDECKYYQNDNDDFMGLCNLLNELHEENMMLKQPHCRKCEYFSCDNADCYCMKKGFDSIDDFNIAKNCKDYMSVLE